MSNEKEILNHFFKGDSQRTIAAVLHVSRNTVAKVVQACHEHPIEAHELDRLDHETLVHHLFPDTQALPIQVQPPCILPWVAPGLPPLWICHEPI